MRVCESLVLNFDLFRKKNMFRVLYDRTHPKIRYVRFFVFFYFSTTNAYPPKLSELRELIYCRCRSSHRGHTISKKRVGESVKEASLSLSYSSSVFCRVENKFFCVV